MAEAHRFMFLSMDWVDLHYLCEAVFLQADDVVPCRRVSGWRLHAKVPKQVRDITYSKPDMFASLYILPLITREPTK